MGMRGDWKFSYRVEEVADAADRKRLYHEDRITFWQTEKEIVVEEIKEKGLEVRGHQITGGERAQVVIDPTLQGRLDECQTKLAEHQRRQEEYAGWGRVLGVTAGRNEELSLELNHDDVRFFGLDGAPEE